MQMKVVSKSLTHSGKPYAVVCRVEQRTLSQTLGPIELNRIWVAVNCKGNDSLQARCVEWRSQGRAGEFWSSRIVDGSKTAFRYGRLGAHDLSEELKESDNKAKREIELMEKSKFRTVYPFEMVACHPSSVLNGFPRSVRDYFSKMLLQRKLVIAKFVEQGIEGVWHIPTADGYSPRYGQVKVVFGKAVDYLPISVEQTIYLDDGKRHTRPETIHTEWKKHGSSFLPEHIEVNRSPSGNETVFILDCTWKLGDEVPQDLVEIDTDDWLEKTRRLFDETWQRKGFSLPSIPQQPENPE